MESGFLVFLTKLEKHAQIFHQISNSDFADFYLSGASFFSRSISNAKLLYLRLKNSKRSRVSLAGTAKETKKSFVL